MNVPKKLFDLVVLRAERALKDDQLELEARITEREKSLTRVGFERLLRYLRKTKAVYEPQHDVLDVMQNYFRVSITDSNRIGQACATGMSLLQLHDEAPDDVTVIRKEKEVLATENEFERYVGNLVTS